MEIGAHRAHPRIPLRFLALGLGYAVAYGILFHLAGYIVGLIEFSLWFPAAGLRFVILLIVGWRFCFVAVLAEILAQGAVGYWAEWGADHIPEMLIGIAGPPLIYGFVVWFLNTRLHVRVERARLRDIAWLCAAALIAPALTAPVGTFFQSLAGRIPWEVFGSATISFWVGDAVGILMLGPPLVFAWLFWTADRDRFTVSASAGLRLSPTASDNQTLHASIEIATILALTIGFVWFFGFQGKAIYWYPAFLPLIWLSLRFSWLGAISSVFVLNLLTAWVAAHLADPGQRINLQLFLIALSGTGVLLGAVISERVRAEQQHIQQIGELAQADRLNSLGELAAGVVHEIRQPLSTISIYAQEGVKRAETQNLSESELRSAFGHIVAQTDRMKRIVQSVHRLSRRGGTQREVIDLNQSIQNAARMLEIEAKDLCIQIHLSLEDTPPKTFGDPVQIEQVILNIGRNGLQSMADIQSAAERVLEIRSLFEGDKVGISITDAGRGLRSEKIEQAFEPFYTSKETGLGLGLSISKVIVTDHGGQIYVSSDPDHGTTFTVLLPVRDLS